MATAAVRTLNKKEERKTRKFDQELWGQNKNFDNFVAFDKAKCTVSGPRVLRVILPKPRFRSSIVWISASF